LKAVNKAELCCISGDNKIIQQTLNLFELMVTRQKCNALMHTMDVLGAGVAVGRSGPGVVVRAGVVVLVVACNGYAHILAIMPTTKKLCTVRYQLVTKVINITYVTPHFLLFLFTFVH
jgi:hypothetical protein